MTARSTSTIRILLIGNYGPDGQHSMQRYSEWLKAMLTGQGLHADLLRPSVRFGKLAARSASAQKWLGYVDKFLIFPFTVLMQAGRYDLIHICDHSNAPYRLFARKTPVAVTCHDLIAVRSMLGEFGPQRPRWSGRLLQKWILSALSGIGIVCCVSQTTRSDLERLAPRTGRRIWTISNPVIGFSPMDANEAEHEIRSAGVNSDGPFFLCVGNNIWYKNRIGIVRLFAEILKRASLADMHLVCAGTEFSPELRTLIADLGIQSRVKEIVSPSSRLLRALYSKATALLFVSLYEGFGWPIIEAQACGCPVITSDRQPMKSIAGDPALVVDPTLPIEAAKAIDDRWEWITSRKEASIMNASRFSEDQAASEYVAFFATAVSPQRQGASQR
jgi:glycosyltransferase involved in cell wall biosynthesis